MHTNSMKRWFINGFPVFGLLFGIALITGCPEDDDMNVDDDTGDDDVGDDDATDDDDVADDDTADDDTADDDTADDDTGDDDDTTEPEDVVVDLGAPVITPTEIPMVYTVTWTSPEPGNSLVEWGESGFVRWAGDDANLTTDHEVLVIGMYASTTYDIRVASEYNGEKHVSQTHSLTTGSIPHNWLTFTWDSAVYDPSRYEPGWVLMNIMRQQGMAETIAVILDEYGEIVWFWEHPVDDGFADVEATMTSDGNILIGGNVARNADIYKVDLAGNIVWTAPEPQSDGMGQEGSYHHCYYENDQGNLVMHRMSSIGMDVLVETDWNYNTIWEFDAWHDSGGESIDFINSNSTVIDHANRLVYNADHNTGVVVIDYDTKEILGVWGWGRIQDPDLGFMCVDCDPWSPDGYHYPWDGPHGIEVVGDQLLTFNNDMLQSRVAEYTIDVVNRVSVLNWSYPDHDGACDNGEDSCFYGGHWGDVDYVGTDNVLVVTGQRNWMIAPCKVFELAPDGNGGMEPVWRVEVSMAIEGSYAADKVPAYAWDK